MSIELSKEAHADAIASIQQYFERNLPEPVGELPAGLLLNFFLEEIGPSIYNKAVADAQERMQMRITELDIEVHHDEFRYWRKFDRPAKPGK